ncbi:MAG: AAA family ATPase [Candidatus Halichondribacter symbioticus]
MPNTSETYSQNDALLEIKKWAKDSPAWQQLAIDKLICNVQPSISDLETLCLEPQDISSQLIGLQTTTGHHSDPISLISIENPNDINALPSDQKLQFESIGLSIIYGDNGSGKSGYCRILKHACRTRDKNLIIEPDVTKDEPATQSATIHYKRGNQVLPMNWNPSNDKNQDLASVSIFDAGSATIQLRDETTVAYVPFPMKVLEELAKVCDELKESLEDKIANIHSKTPRSIKFHTLSGDTDAGKYVKNLSWKSQRERLDSLITISDEEQNKLETLNADLAKDSKNVKERLISIKSRFEGKFKQLQTLAEAVSDNEIKKFIELKKQHKVAKDVVEIASKELSLASLPQVGGEVWLSLWGFAKQYSNQIERPFPGVNPDQDLCMLCQQTLKEDAIKRLQTFDNFVKGEAQSKEAKVKTELNAFEAKLKDSALSEDFTTEIIALVRDIFKREEFANHVETFIANLSVRLQSCIDGKPLEAKSPVFQKAEYDDCLMRISRRIEQLNLNHDDPKWLALLQEQKELQDRVTLAGMVGDIIAEIDHKKEIKKIEDAIKTIKKRKVTNKNKELSDQLVTPALRERFTREVEKLKVRCIPLQLQKTRDKDAQSLFQIKFKDHPNKAVGAVLSEGEHRCVALAAFLAELFTADRKSGIVFDDPMSSLDHIYRERIAKRLAEEAAHRQVIIFTHDLSFMFELKRNAERRDINPWFQHVRRKTNKPGYVFNELPMKAKSAYSMVCAIQSNLKKNKASYDNFTDDVRIIFIKGVLEQLREAWDQTIADFIQPVLGRFDNQIKGSSIYKLLDLTEEDVKTITNARSRLSEYLHVESEALNSGTITHEYLRNEVDEILEYINSLKTRPKTPKPILY